MTRVGWIFLRLAVLAAAALMSMTRFGGGAMVAAASPGTGRAGPLPAPVRQPAQPAVVQANGGGDVMPVLQVPVQGVKRAAITDTWGQARSQGRVHHGTDIPALKGTPVLAAADGIVEKLFLSRLGGMTLYERSLDRRWTFYYAHLSGYAPGLHEGQAVRAGQPIAMVGDTGDAGAGNYHLHFGLTRTTPDQHWYQGEDTNAYPLLAAGPPAR